MIKIFCRMMLIIPLVTLIGGGCSEHLIKPEHSGEPKEIFEIIWEEFDRYYPFFIDKEIDWNSVYDQYKSRIDNSIDDEHLFEILSEMLATFKDGHVNLYTPYGTSTYDGWYDKYPRNFYFDRLVNRYLRDNRNTTGNGNILYGIIGSIGYVYIRSFSGEGNWAESIDEVIEKFIHLDGVIVDVRHNGGGRIRDANIIAGRFADRQYVYSYTQFRNGPRHSDFTELTGRTVAPGGERQYLKPVVLLTNRSTFSAAENFTLMMRKFSHVTHIGDTTGGGLGNPVFRELPNGWGYRLPVWRQLAADKSVIEGIGIFPDRPVHITPLDLHFQRDTILDYAINLLK